MTTENTTQNPLLLFERDGAAAVLTLNRGKARNSLSNALMAELIDALETCAGDDAVRVVILKAAGPAFCAGHDLKELRAHAGERAFFEDVFAQCSKLMQAIVHLPKPVIAQVHGIATAAGCQLVASCDLAIATQSARFATPGVNIGLFCSTPMVALSRNVGRKQAMEMLLLGEMIDAETALRYGLINRAVPEDELDGAVREMADKIIAKSPLTLAIGKEAFYAQADMDLAAAYDYAAKVMTTNMLAADAGEGISAFLEKRPPTWRGC
jgi:enoyl-CoA hydratase/carnithine racemase